MISKLVIDLNQPDIGEDRPGATVPAALHHVTCTCVGAAEKQEEPSLDQREPSLDQREPAKGQGQHCCPTALTRSVGSQRAAPSSG